MNLKICYFGSDAASNLQSNKSKVVTNTSKLCSSTAVCYIHHCFWQTRLAHLCYIQSNYYNKTIVPREYFLRRTSFCSVNSASMFSMSTNALWISLQRHGMHRSVLLHFYHPTIIKEMQKKEIKRNPTPVFYQTLCTADRHSDLQTVRSHQWPPAL